METAADRSNPEVPVVHGSQSLTVNSRSTGDIRLVLKTADKVHGSFRILRTHGYGDKELKFRVLDNTETRISKPVVLDLGTVVSEASFEFTAVKPGDYGLVFDNEPTSSDSNSQKEIQLTYEITSHHESSARHASHVA